MDSVLAPPDILLLCWTLVKDGVLPRGYESPRDSHSERSEEGAQADGRFRQPHSCSVAPPKKSSKPAEGTIRAARGRPSKFRARWQEKYYDGPNAGRDAEEALRTKWLQELEALLKGTKTPMGSLR